MLPCITQYFVHCNYIESTCTVKNKVQPNKVLSVFQDTVKPHKIINHIKLTIFQEIVMFIFRLVKKFFFNLYDVLNYGLRVRTFCK